MVGVGRGGRAGRNVELAEDIADVTVDRSPAQAQGVSDLLVGAAVRDEAEHVKLSRREPTLRGLFDKRDRGVETRQIRPSPQSFEHGSRGLALQP